MADDKKKDGTKNDDKEKEKFFDVDKDPDAKHTPPAPKEVKGKITGGEMKDHDGGIDASQSAKPVPKDVILMTVEPLK